MSDDELDESGMKNYSGFSPLPWRWTGGPRDRDELVDANGKPVLKPVAGWDSSPLSGDLGIRTGPRDREDVARANEELIVDAGYLAIDRTKLRVLLWRAYESMTGQDVIRTGKKEDRSALTTEIYIALRAIDWREGRR